MFESMIPMFLCLLSMGNNRLCHLSSFGHQRSRSAFIANIQESKLYERGGYITLGQQANQSSWDLFQTNVSKICFDKASCWCWKNVPMYHKSSFLRFVLWVNQICSTLWTQLFVGETSGFSIAARRQLLCKQFCSLVCEFCITAQSWNISAFRLPRLRRSLLKIPWLLALQSHFG